MKENIISFSKYYKTDKANSLLELGKNDIKIPKTAFINSDDMNLISEFIEVVSSWNENEYYVRCCFSDVEYPHYLSTFAKKRFLKKDVEELICNVKKNNIKNFDIICQPLLEKTEWSGGLIKRNDSVYFEIVKGASMVMFRKGQFYARYLKNDSGTFTDYGNQKEVISFSNGVIQNDIFFSEEIDLESIYKSLESDKLLEEKLYEFGIINNQAYYFESKSLLKNTYLNLEALFLNSKYCLNGECASVIDKQIILDEPLFDYIGNYEFDKDTKIIVRTGSILSHLSFYLVQNSILCEYILTD